MHNITKAIGKLAFFHLSGSRVQRRSILASLAPPPGESHHPEHGMYGGTVQNINWAIS